MKLIRNQENSQTKKTQYIPASLDELFQSIKKKNINHNSNVEEYVQSIYNAFSKPNNKTKIANYFISQCLFYNDNLFESKNTIASRVGVSLATVGRASKEVRKLGIIVVRRRFNKSNVYKINPLLRHPEIIEMFASILPALRGLLCLSILIPMAVLCKPYSARDLQKNDPLHSLRSYLLTPEPDRIKSLCTKQTMNVGVYPTKRGEPTGSELKKDKKEEKTLKREVCSPLNNEKVLVMNCPFLKTNAQRSADVLGLTLAGAVKIAMYSEETHAHAFKEYCNSAKVKNKEIADPIRYYASICNKYCNAHGLNVDYGMETRLSIQHKISHDNGLYLPEDQRVYVDIPETKTAKAEHKSASPFKPLPSTLHLAKNAYVKGHQDYPLDNIKEAIKAWGYKNSGLMSEKQTIWSDLFPFDAFHKKALAQIRTIKENHGTYILDVKEIYDYVNESIESYIEKNQLTIDPELAKMNAHTAMAGYMPQILEELKGHVALAKGV